MSKKVNKKDIVDYICTRFLQYKPGQPPPGFVGKKLDNFNYYSLEIVFETIKQSESDIEYWMQNKNFSSDYARVSYILAIVNNRIAEVNRVHERTEKIKERESLVQQCFTDPTLSTGNHVDGKDISEFLEEVDSE